MHTNTERVPSEHSCAVSISRTVGERIKVSGPCEIEVTRVRGNKVTVVVFADPETYLARSEIYDPSFESMSPDERRAEGERRRAAKHSETPAH